MDSRTIASGDRSATGQYEVWVFGSLLSLRMGMILTVFQFVGILLELTMLMKSFVRTDMEW